MEKYTRSTFSSLRYLDENGGGKKIGRYFSRVSFTTCVSFSPLPEYTLVHSMCRCRKLNLLGRQGASLFTSGFRRLFAKLLLRNWGEGGVRAYRRNEFTFLSQLPSPPFTFPRKEPEIYTCTNMRFLPTNLLSLYRWKREGRITR